jgi:hypothetical protein
MKSIYLLIFILVTAAAGCAQDAGHNKMDHGKMHHDATGREKAGTEMAEKGMGFSQSATTHHFLITKSGGAIQVEVKDPNDTANRDKVRSHLAEIAKQFQEGVFTTPFAVHGEMPPGVDAMDKLKEAIKYSYRETDNGARVEIATSNPEALAAIHSFLKFQIEEHKTGDPIDGVR